MNKLYVDCPECGSIFEENDESIDIGEELRCSFCGHFFTYRNGESKVTNLKNELNEIFSKVEMDGNTKSAIIESVMLKLENTVSLTTLQEKLKVLYEYEKNYLELVKEYKEEIKFAATLQEDLRKERTKFFSESLKEVSATLKESQVDSNVASIWIRELVNSYTKSLDLSSGLIEDHTIDMIGEIRQKAKQEAVEIRNKNEQEG